MSPLEGDPEEQESGGDPSPSPPLPGSVSLEEDPGEQESGGDPPPLPSPPRQCLLSRRIQRSRSRVVTPLPSPPLPGSVSSGGGSRGAGVGWRPHLLGGELAVPPATSDSAQPSAGGGPCADAGSRPQPADRCHRGHTVSCRCCGHTVSCRGGGTVSCRCCGLLTPVKKCTYSISPTCSPRTSSFNTGCEEWRRLHYIQASN